MFGQALKVVIDKVLLDMLLLIILQYAKSEIDETEGEMLDYHVEHYPSGWFFPCSLIIARHWYQPLCL